MQADVENEIIALTGALSSLLDQEIALLQSGSVSAALELRDAKEAGLAQLEGLLARAAVLGPDGGREPIEAALRSLAIRAQHASVLLDSVHHGVSSLVERMSSHAGESLVGAYGEDGRKVSFSENKGKILKSL